jgi:hypothetical protein
MKKYFILILLITILTAGCSHTGNESQTSETEAPYSEAPLEENNNYIPEVEFTGVKGETVNLANGEIAINSSNLKTGVAKYYNAQIPSGKTVYFFVVKDKDGKHRAAANACQVCHNAMMGFRQEGNYMVCNTCGNKYPMEKIATEKGGCNPGPISTNLALNNGRLIIEQSDLLEVIDLF